MKKAEGKKSLKWLIIAIIALVLVAAVGVTLWLLMKKEPEQTAPEGMKIYWNVERSQYVAKGENGISARYPREDGYYYIRFAVEGEQVDLPVESLELVNYADSMDFMGLELNDAGVVVGVYHVDEFTGGLAADHYYVESVEGTKVVVNTAGSMKGVSIDIEIPEGTPLYNVGETGLLCGVPAQGLNRDDEIVAIKDTDGKIFMVYVMPYKEPGPIYWNVTRMYDSAAGMSTRVSDVLGYYSIDFAYGGQIVTLRTKDREVVNAIDKQAARCFALDFDEEGLITGTRSTGTETKGSATMSWFHVIEINGNTVTGKKIAAGSDQGQVTSGQLTQYTKVVLTTTGEYTQPQVGDQIHCLTDARGNLAYVFVISRLSDTAKIGWNVERKYNSANKVTSRVPDKDGYYHIAVASEGQQLQLKTKEQALVNQIDASAARCFSFDHEGDILTGVYSTGVVTGGGTAMSWYHVDSVNEDGTITATKRTDTSSSEYGQTVTKKMAEDCGIYNGSTNSAFVGEETTLQPGDQIHCLTNLQGELHTIIIVSRPYDLPIYWNVTRMYNSTTKQTTRVPAEDGYYYIEMCTGGKTVTVKTANKAIATQIDSNAAKCWGLDVWDGIVWAAYGVSNIEDTNGGVEVSWCNITRVTQYSAQAIKNSTGADNGNTYVINYAYGCKFYDVSDDFKEVRGEETQLRVGDLVHCLKNSQGLTTYVWIISRGPENGFMDYCNMCKKNVLWSAWDGTEAMAAGVHYFLEDDVHLDTYTTTSGGNVSLFLNGHTLSSDSRAIRLNSGTILNIYDSMEDGSDIGGKIVGKGLTQQEADAEQKGTSEGGVIILWGGNTLNLYSGTLELAAEHNTVKHGGVLAGNGTFNMYGGKLTGGETTAGGGTVRRYGGNTVTNIYGGIIDGGVSGSSGGSISIGGAGCTLNIYGGTFTGGSAAGTGDDIWIEANTKLTLGGKLNIGDVYINGTATVEDLEEGSSIGVNCADITTPFATVADAKDASCFVSTSSHLEVKAEGNDLYLVSNLKPHNHCVCAGLAKGVGDHTACTTEQWTPWTSTTSLPTASGNYYLLEDVTSAGFTMTNDTDIKLCLNGHDVTLTSLIWLKGNFAVTDCTGNGTIYGTRAGHSNLFYSYELSNFYLYAGTLSGEKATGINYAVVNLCDDDRDGDGVRERSSFYMYGGKIVGRDATGQMGSSVRLMRNTAFYMYGGTIDGDKAAMGSAVYMDGAASTVHLLGGTITGGKSDKGAVYAKAGKLTIGGDMQITGNTTLDGSAPSNVYIADNLKADLTKLGSGAKIGVSMTNPGVFAENVSDLTEQITSDAEDCKVVYQNKTMALESTVAAHSHCVCGGNAEDVGDHTSCSSVNWTAWDGTSALTSGGYYYLTANVTRASVKVEVGQTITICLNGHTINTGADRSLRIFGDLTVTDCGTTGKITTARTGLATVFYVQASAEFNLYGGSLVATGKSSQAGVGAISDENEAGAHVAPGKMNIYGGTITGGNVTGDSGLIAMWNGTTLNIYGGTLTNGKCGKNGGLINVGGNCNLNIYGGEFSNGTASNVGSAIMLAATAKLTLSGKPVFQNNTEEDIWTSGVGNITVTGLDASVRIKVNMTDERVFANNVTTDLSDCFESGNSAYEIVWENNTLVFKKK